MEMGTFDSILYLKCFIQAVKFQWPTQRLLWPLGNSVWPQEGQWVHVENHCTRGWGVLKWEACGRKDYIAVGQTGWRTSNSPITHGFVPVERVRVTAICSCDSPLGSNPERRLHSSGCRNSSSSESRAAPGNSRF